MEFWESIKAKRDAVQAKLGMNPLIERVWKCEPLLVLDDRDGSVAYAGATEVDVVPHADGTADLTARAERDGWHPNLVGAQIELVEGWTNITLFGGAGTYRRSGMICRGSDSEGVPFTWYVNGAAEQMMMPDAISWNPPDSPEVI